MKRIIRSILIIVIGAVVMLSACNSKDNGATQKTHEPSSTTIDAASTPHESTSNTATIPQTTSVSDTAAPTGSSPENTLISVDSPYYSLLLEIQKEYEVRKFEADERKILIGINETYADINELALSVQTLSKLLNADSNNKWEQVSLLFEGIKVEFTSKTKWDNWISCCNTEPVDLRYALHYMAEAAITDINLNAATFYLERNVVVTPLDGLNAAKKTFGITDNIQNEDEFIEINYAGMTYRNEVVYLYTVNQIIKEPTTDETLNNKLYELVVYPISGFVADYRYKERDCIVRMTDPFIRNAVLQEGILLNKYRLDPEHSIMTTLEDYKYEKMLKVECFENGDLGKPTQMIVHLKCSNEKWIVANVIPADQYYEINNEPLEKYIFIKNENTMEIFDYSDLSEKEKSTIKDIDSLIENNKLYLLELFNFTGTDSIKYDFDKDGKISELKFSITQHKNARGRYTYREFEMSCGNSTIYLLGYANRIGICDVDKNDQSIELFVADSGSTIIDMRSTIFRINEEGIERFVDRLNLILGVSGDGKVYYWGGNLKETPYDNFNSDYVIRYFDINLMEYVDTDQIIGKSFTDLGNKIVFENEEQAPSAAPIEFSMESPGAIYQTKEGEKVTILDFGWCRAKIQCEDGLIGWIGGFPIPAVSAIDINDFDINYNGFIINDTLPFKEVADSIGIEIGKVISSLDIPKTSQIGNWYIVHYPSKDKEDMQIEYVINEKAGTQYLVYVELFNVPTYRGISVGDDIDDLLLAYGDSIKPTYASPTEDLYYYKLDNKSESMAPDKTIYISVDKNTKKITRISIDYNSNKAIEELDMHP